MSAKDTAKIAMKRGFESFASWLHYVSAFEFYSSASWFIVISCLTLIPGGHATQSPKKWPSASPGRRSGSNAVVGAQRSFADTVNIYLEKKIADE